jgi:hypothetical protein
MLTRYPKTFIHIEDLSSLNSSVIKQFTKIGGCPEGYERVIAISRSLGALVDDFYVCHYIFAVASLQFTILLRFIPQSI